MISPDVVVVHTLQVLTFDAYGVSGHINHRCVHEGVRCVFVFVFAVCVCSVCVCVGGG